MTVKLLAFCASTRKESFNRKLFPIVVAGAREAGAEVTAIDLKQYEGWPGFWKNAPNS